MNKSTRAQYKKLTVSNKNFIRTMLPYLKNTLANEFAINDLTEEIIHTALEKQEQGVSLNDVFGEDSEKYCLERIKTIKKKSIGEWINYVLFYTFMYIFVFLLYAYLHPIALLSDFKIIYFDTNWGEVFYIFILPIVTISFSVIYRSYIRKLLKAVILITLAIVIPFIIVIIKIEIHDFNITLNVPIVAVIIAFGSICTYYLYNKLAKMNYNKGKKEE